MPIIPFHPPVLENAHRNAQNIRRQEHSNGQPVTLASMDLTSEFVHQALVMKIINIFNEQIMAQVEGMVQQIMGTVIAT